MNPGLSAAVTEEGAAGNTKTAVHLEAEVWVSVPILSLTSPVS